MRSDDVEKSDFEPSMKILPRIMRIILENESMNRTTLTQAANINYTRLCKLNWNELII